MRRLVTCSDGTWKSSESETRTNVYYVSRAILPRAPDGVEQLVLYDAGVGAEGSFVDRISGGAFGKGLDDNILDAYRFFVDNYEEGDRLYLFGFSRGAYTARSAVGLIRKCGILRREHADRIEEAYELYRRRDDHVDGPAARAFRERYSRPTPKIAFLGVWDTVGALGIPLLGLRWLTRRKYQFHDTELSGIVEKAFHAVSIDERRGPFRPTLWSETPKPDQIVEQTWFPGVHSDIGGGYEERGLADVTFAWMVTRAELYGGLAFDHEYIRRELNITLPHTIDLDNARYDAELHDSLTGVYRLLHRHDRTIQPDAPTQAVWQTAEQRYKDSTLGYRPKPLVQYFAAPNHRVARHGVFDVNV